MQQDLALLHRAFEALHPELYRYNSRSQIEDEFSTLDREFARGETLPQAYLGFSRLCAEIRCGHTYPNFYNQSKAIKSALFERPDKVPFFFRWLGRRMIVTRDFTPEKALPPGTEIVSINGVPVPQLLAKLLPYVRGDGANNYKRVALLQVQGDDTYGEFDVYYPMLFDCSSGSYRLVVRLPKSRQNLEIEAKALSYAERKASIPLDPSGDAPLFSVRYMSGGVALLTMPTWEMYKTKWPWETWLNQTLDDVVARKCKALIVDLRGNEGGNDVGSTLLKRLSRSASGEKLIPLVRFQKLPEEFRPWAKEWDGSGWNDKAWIASTSAVKSPVPSAPEGIEYFVRNDGDDETDTRQEAPRFSGSLYVLVDSSVSSATFNFAQAVQRNHLGTILGEPTGGNKRGINGGQFIFIKLPNSGIEVDIPLVGTFPIMRQPDEGLQPDVKVDVSVQSLSNGTDLVLGRTLQMISQMTRSAHEMQK